MADPFAATADRIVDGLKRANDRGYANFNEVWLREAVAAELRRAAAPSFIEHDCRVTELLESNNALLERARKAEAALKEMGV